MVAGSAQVLQLNTSGLLRVSPNQSKLSLGLGRLFQARGGQVPEHPVPIPLGAYLPLQLDM